LEKERAHKKAELEAEKRRLLQEQLFDKFLGQLKTNEISLAEFFDHVFNPETKLNSDWHWRGFFAHQNTVQRVFGYWTTSKYNRSTREFLQEWANEHVSKTASAEARAITQSGILSKSKKVVNERFFLDFSLAELTRTLRGMAPTMFRVLNTFASTPHQLKRASERFLEKKELVCPHA
jgi:hypothetical protein